MAPGARRMVADTRQRSAYACDPSAWSRVEVHLTSLHHCASLHERSTGKSEWASARVSLSANVRDDLRRLDRTGLARLVCIKAGSSCLDLCLAHWHVAEFSLQL
eukprot:6196736-Pleurochrysis_carterae.AAC.2